MASDILVSVLDVCNGGQLLARLLIRETIQWIHQGFAEGGASPTALSLK